MSQAKLCGASALCCAELAAAENGVTNQLVASLASMCARIKGSCGRRPSLRLGHEELASFARVPACHGNAAVGSQGTDLFGACLANLLTCFKGVDAAEN